MLVLLDFLKKLVGLSFVFDIVRREAEREHILRTLKDTNWVVGGPGGAAARLGMKRTTRNSLVKRLGITPEVKSTSRPLAISSRASFVTILRSEA